jgi:hypothetical protein
MLSKLESLSLDPDPVVSIVEWADAIQPLSRAIYEAARIDMEAAAAMRQWATFARRAREAVPTASRLAAVLKGFGEHQESFDQIVGALEQQQGVVDTFEGLLSLLAKAKLLARRADDRQAAIAAELRSVFEEAREAGLLTSDDVDGSDSPGISL